MRIIILFFIFFPLFTNGQQWQALGAGFNWNLTCLFADSINNLLYAGGPFTQAGNKSISGIAKWDGNNWDSLCSGIGNLNPCRSILQFQNKLFACGFFDSAGNLPIKYIANWNGLNWDSLPLHPNAGIFNAKIINGNLFVTGVFTGIDSIRSVFVASWDGNFWTGYDLGIDSTFIGGVYSIEEYNGQLYIAGNILPIEDIIMYDGISTHQLGSGIHGGLSIINSLAVYNNELYVGGYFFQSDGNAGNCIMKWNGSQWSDVGGGVNNHVYTLKVHKGILYAAGVFNIAGGVNASRIAKWDGQSWSALGPEIFDNVITCMDFMGDDLYVGGGFWHIDTLTVNGIAKYSNIVSVEEIGFPLQINLSPNPVNNKLRIRSNKLPIDNVKSMDFLGREIYSEKISGSNETLDVSFLAPGLYFLNVQTSKGSCTMKFIKE